MAKVRPPISPISRISGRRKDTGEVARAVSSTSVPRELVRVAVGVRRP